MCAHVIFNIIIGTLLKVSINGEFIVIYLYAAGDTILLIAKTAIQSARSVSTVLVGYDADLLALLSALLPGGDGCTESIF